MQSQKKKPKEKSRKKYIINDFAKIIYSLYIIL